MLLYSFAAVHPSDWSPVPRPIMKKIMLMFSVSFFLGTIFRFGCWGHILAKVGPRTPLIGSGSTNGAKRTQNQLRGPTIMSFRSQTYNYGINETKCLQLRQSIPRKAVLLSLLALGSAYCFAMEIPNTNYCEDRATENFASGRHAL